ncbi:MAG: hypothetical protein Q4D16_09595 [Eubacteriales bacterium]|nr:hypothetical protein [Eubacteriales bacterium]
MKMKKLQAILLAGILCLGGVSTVWGGEFSDSTHAEKFSEGDDQDAGEVGVFTDDTPRAGDILTSGSEGTDGSGTDASGEDYAVKLISDGNSINIHYAMGQDRFNLFGGMYIKNVGKKDISLNVTSQKYIEPILNYPLSAGEEDTLEFDPIEANMVMGEFSDDILTIEDATGNIHIELEIHLSVTGDGGFSVDKKELDFGEYHKGENMPAPQTVAVNVEEETDLYNGDWELLWKKGDLKGNLEGNVDAAFDKEFKTITVTPRADLEPGEYEGYLSVRNEDIDNYGHQEDIKIKITVLPEKPDNDYVVRVNSDVLNLKLDLCDEDAWHFYGAISITNIGDKPVDIDIKDSKYAEMVLENNTSVAQPGETIYYTCEPVFRNIVVGEYTDDKIIVTDTTGKINIEVPVHVTVTGADVFTLDRNELNFGSFVKGQTPPLAQGVIPTVKEGYSVLAGEWTFIWESKELEDSFNAYYDKTLKSFVIGPKNSIEPGYYSGRLSVRNGGIGNGEIGQKDITVKLTVKHPVPKITKVTVNKNMITVNISRLKGETYDCSIISKGTGGKEKTVRAAANRTGTKVVFRNVPKGVYEIRACGVYEGMDGTERTEASVYKNVKINTVTPARPVMEASVSGRNVKLKVSIPKNAAGYNIRIGTAQSKSDDSKTVIYAPAKTVYSKNGQTAKTVTVKNLKKGTYYVGVQAYSIQNGQKVYSQWSKLQKIVVS